MVDTRGVFYLATDEHGFSRIKTECLSVFICVNPWLTFSSSCGGPWGEKRTLAGLANPESVNRETTMG